MNWQGVIPAITTPFRPDLSVDFELLRRHVDWLVRKGATGIVALGSLGEGGTLGFDEKRRIGVVILHNSAVSIDDLGFHLLNAQFPLTPAKPRPAPLPAAFRDRCAPARP